MIHYVVLQFVTALIRGLEFLFFARAIMSWFVQGSDSGISGIYEFLYMVTEPIVQPFRKLTERIDALRGVPVDIAFFLAFLSLEFILILLYSIV